MIVEAIIVIAVAFLFSYIISYFVSGQASYKGLQPLYSLSREETVLSYADLPWGTGPCALRFGINVQEAPRTVAKVDCIQIRPTNPIATFGPSCADYTFQTCECAGTNCTRCMLPTDNTGYLQKLLGIGDRLELWASGYTSQNDKPYVPAILKIKTAKDGSQYFMESISLPAIPLQRWTIVTIVKEGRRFDIYYGEKLVASKILQYVPLPPDNGQPWKAGNPRWKGQIGFFNGVSSTWTTDNVKEDVQAIVNTQGVPFYIDQIKLSMPNLNVDMPNLKINMPDCIFGSCNEMPTVKPRDPSIRWQSNVS